LITNLLQNLRFRDVAAVDPESRATVTDVPPLAERAALFRRAAEVCANGGDIARALTYFGRAIDSYLGLGDHRTAAEICRAVVRMAPGVIRTRCTYGLLLIGERLERIDEDGIPTQAVRHLQAYVDASLDADAAAIAAHRLLMLGEVTDYPAVRGLIADLLLDLGAPDDASALRRLPDTGSARSTPEERAAAQRQRWASLLRIPIVEE
jgi:hypothetical protein